MYKIFKKLILKDKITINNREIEIITEKRNMKDNINHPEHYGGEDNPYETIKVIEAWNMDFNLGNAIKYISRAGKKNNKVVEDLKKAIFYIDREIQNYQLNLNVLEINDKINQDIDKKRKYLNDVYKNLLKPKIVCLCGSTRFYKEFVKQNYNETMKGNIVLSVGFYPHSSNEMHGEKIGITSEQKVALDELHKRKIDLCDEVLILNIGGYIGESTKNELEYARSKNKKISFLEPIITNK